MHLRWALAEISVWDESSGRDRDGDQRLEIGTRALETERGRRGLREVFEFPRSGTLHPLSMVTGRVAGSGRFEIGFRVSWVWVGLKGFGFGSSHVRLGQVWVRCSFEPGLGGLGFRMGLTRAWSG